MSNKPYNKQSTSKKVRSVIIVNSKSKPDLRHGEEAEIAAQISIPTDGGWGWVVLAASVMNIFLLDGITFTYGTLIASIEDDFSITVSMAALLGSTESALYYMVSPFASALINKFGFRVCVMTGSILCSISKLCAHFCTSFATLCLLYGWVNGFGSAFINMSSSLIVGFYFEKYRTIALSITSCGTSLGIMIMAPVNIFLVGLAGWRSTVLLHSGMLGLIFFFGLTFKPILSMTIIESGDEEIEEPTRTVTIIPVLNDTDYSSKGPQQLQPSGAERLFSAPSSIRFPTAAKIVSERAHNFDTLQTTSTAPTTSGVSKLTLKINKSDKKLSQMQSMISDLKNRNIPIKIITTDDENKHEKDDYIDKSKKPGCCGGCCLWQETSKESRPLYRDDIFYEGELESLPAYQKSVMEISPGERTGLEYQLAVSRAVTLKDIEEKKCLNATAVRRILATMLDPVLFKRRSFVVMCVGGFVTYLGLLVPVIFIPDRNADAGITSQHCGLFLSVIGFANTVGRLGCGFIVKKIDPVYLHAVSLMVSGLSTMISTLSYDLYFQYGYCVVYGLSMAGVGGIRSVMLVSLYGLEKLTNATGVMLIFLGLGSMVSTPLAGGLKQLVGYNTAFHVAGGLIASSSFIYIGVKKLATAENKLLKENDDQ